jgi:transcription antitermination factor NusG
MAQFKTGDHVRILTTVATPFAGLNGEIREVRQHDRGVATLDQYVVRFSWGENVTFYDVQLELAVSQPKKRQAA